MQDAIATFIHSGYWVRILLFTVLSIAVCTLHGVFWKRILKIGVHPWGFLASGSFPSWPLNSSPVGRWSRIACPPTFFLRPRS